MNGEGSLSRSSHYHHGASRSRASEKAIGSSIGSILIAIVTSSHHWVHMLLIALGLGAVGAGLFTMPIPIRIGLLVVSVVVSIGMLFVAWRKRTNNKAVAWVYFISSVVSLVIIATSVPTLVQSAAPSVHQEHHHNGM
ncbi:MAG: hypothetical protein K6T83_13525 [Alicyclobacillus sp.]|nr:hypothetical protein [Alicyclobacillus sp.]